MSVNVEIVSPVTPAQVEDLIQHMRPECIADLKGLGWESVREAMEPCLERAENTTAILINGKVAMMCGVYGDDKVWIWATTLVTQYPVEFLEHSKKAAAVAMGQRSRLTNYVHDAFQQSIRWLKWLGAEIGPPEPRGPHGEMYRRATITKEALNVR